MMRSIIAGLKSSNSMYVYVHTHKHTCTTQTTIHMHNSDTPHPTLSATNYVYMQLYASVINLWSSGKVRACDSFTQAVCIV